MEDADKYSEEALEIWGKMEKQIGKIIRKILHFNSAYEYEDYLQEAYIACHNSILKYNSHIKNKKRSNGNSKMPESISDFDTKHLRSLLENHPLLRPPLMPQS